MAKRSLINRIINSPRKLIAFHCFRMYFRILHSCLKIFGFGPLFLCYVVKIPLTVLYVRITMLLDNIFHPGYRRVKIVKPVFIIGHPRTGSTFLHTILTQTEEFPVFKRWETISPALLGRKLFHYSHKLQVLLFLLIDFRSIPYRFKRKLKIEKANEAVRSNVADATKLLKERGELIAHEEEVLFMNILDTQFLTVVVPLGFVDKGLDPICYNDEQPHQERSVLFLKGCLQRQIYFTGKKQILAKVNYSMFRVKTLLKVFPDAKFIYVARSPLQTIPSHLSLHRTAIDQQFGLSNIPPETMQKYYRLRYEYNLEHYKRFAELMKNGVIPKDRVLEFTYDSLTNDLWNTLKQVRDFGGLEFSPELEGLLKEQDKKQASYKRPHKNLSLEDFNLTEEKIRSDFDFAFKQYGFK